MAAPVVITASLMVLMSGCAGAAAQGGQVRDDLRPAANAASQVFTHDRVVVADRLEQAIESATQERAVQGGPVVADRLEQVVESATQERAVQGGPVVADRLEQESATQAQQVTSSTVARGFTPTQIREMKGIAPVAVEDDLSPLGTHTPTGDEPTTTVDDDLSPLGDSH